MQNVADTGYGLAFNVNPFKGSLGLGITGPEGEGMAGGITRMLLNKLLPSLDVVKMIAGANPIAPGVGLMSNWISAMQFADKIAQKFGLETSSKLLGDIVGMQQGAMGGDILGDMAVGVGKTLETADIPTLLGMLDGPFGARAAARLREYGEDIFANPAVRGGYSTAGIAGSPPGGNFAGSGFGSGGNQGNF